MFCVKCGTELPENGEFCPKCGKRVEKGEETPWAVSTDNSIERGEEEKHSSERLTVSCPYCGEKNCQPVIKSSTTTSGGGYSCFNGICGGLLLGPLGLLCGIGGKKVNSTTTNQTWWICHSCGKEFRSREDALADFNGDLLLGLIVTCGLSIFCGLFFIIGGWSASEGNILFGFGSVALAGLTLFLCARWHRRAMYDSVKKTGYMLTELLPEQGEYERWEREEKKRFTKFVFIGLGLGFLWLLFVVFLQ